MPYEAPFEAPLQVPKPYIWGLRIRFMRVFLFFPALILAFLLLSGCSQSPQQPQSSQQQNTPILEYSNYTDGYLSFSYPDWPDAQTNDQNFLVKNNGTCVFAAARYPSVPSRMLKDRLEGEFNGSFGGTGGEYLDFTMNPGGTQYDARTRIIYCNYDTYSLTLACTGNNPDLSFLASASCRKRNLIIVQKSALIPTPANDKPSGILPAIKEARENGVDVLDWYFDWYGLDGNWSVSDYVMEPLSYEGRSAAMVEVIHTSVLSKYPERYDSFDDPGFDDEFSDFSADFVSRYKPDYYFVGSEVDDYLYNHREKIPAFKELLRKTREKVKAASPATKFGFTVTFHDALRNNATDIAQTLAPEADLVAYTSHGYHDMFVYDNVSQGVAYLEGVKDVVPGKPYVIIETGWSSSTLLNSSEDRQAEFMGAYFDFIRANTTDAEFVKWWGLNDGKDCTEGAESFLTEHPELKEDESFMVPFKEYLCSVALKRSDGTPKKAWLIWQENS